MDHYDLSNLPLLADCVDTRESHRYSRLTDEQNTRVTFAGRSATVSRPEQAELQQPLLIYEVQLLAEQTAIADFDISLLSNTADPATLDESKDPFAALATYQPPTFDDDSQHPSDNELGLGSGLLEGFTAEDLADVVKAEPDGNDVLEQPKQSQGESDAQGIIIPESTTPDTVSDKHSGKRRALEPRNVLLRGIPKSSIEHSIKMHFQKSLCGSERLAKTRRKPNSKETETRNQSAAMPETSATSPRRLE